MKITNIVHGYFPALGGVEHLIRMVSEHLVSDFQDEVDVITTDAFSTALFVDPSQKRMKVKEFPEEIAGVKVFRFKVDNSFAKFLKYLQEIAYRLHLPWNGFLRAVHLGPRLPGAIRMVKETDADVILASSFPLLHMYYPFWAKTGKPIVLMGCFHPADTRNFDRKDVWKLIRRCDAYIALTNFEKEFLVERGIEGSKVHVIGGGVEVSTFHNHKKETDIREKYGFEKNQNLIAFVGQQGGHKGVDTIIDSMEKVWLEEPDTGVLIVGGETPFTPQFKKAAEIVNTKSKGKGKIVIGGRISEEEKIDVLHQCDIFVSPSGHESFGISTIEAWACSKPIVGCRIPATMSLIDEYETGVLINYQDSEELSTVLVELLGDESLRRRLGENGYKKVSENYDWKIITKKFREVYKRLI